jgi:iron(III) transport system permease protein
MPRSHPTRSTLLVVVGGALLVLVVVPLVMMLRTVVGDSVGGGASLGTVLTRPGLGAAVLTSLGLALAVTVLAVPVGAGLALALRGPQVPARALLRVAVLLPVIVPDFVLAYSWQRAYGVAGLSDDLLGLAWPGLQSLAGIVVVVTVNVVPVSYLVVAAGLAARAEPAAVAAARAAGAGPATVLRTITLPLLRPALASAAVLVFVLTLGAFAVPQVLGTPAGVSTVTTRIYADLARSSEPAAFDEAIILALLLVLFAAAVVAPVDTLLGPRLRARRTATTDPDLGLVPGSRKAGRWATAGVSGYLLLGVGVPLLALLGTALTRAVGLAPVPANWTLSNFTAALTPDNAAALGHSMLLAGLAAVLLALLGAAVAAVERRGPGRFAGILVTLTFVLPGSTLAVGLLVSYGRWLGGTLALILLAYLAKLWAFAHRPITGALDRLPPDELRASRIGGAGPLTAVRTVVLRPVAPALLAGALVCFLTALHEVTMSSLLYGPGSETLAVVVLNSEELGQVGQTAALSVLVTLLTLVPAGIALLLFRQLRRPGRLVGALR